MDGHSLSCAFLEPLPEVDFLEAFSSQSAVNEAALYKQRSVAAIANE